MSKTGSIGIFPIIIALTIGYNLFFDDDDDEKTITTKEQTPEIKEQLKDVGGQLKDVGIQLKENLTKIIDDAKEKYNEDATPEDELRTAEARKHWLELQEGMKNETEKLEAQIKKDLEDEEEKVEVEPEPEPEPEEPKGRVL